MRGPRSYLQQLFCPELKADTLLRFNAEAAMVILSRRFSALLLLVAVGCGVLVCDQAVL